MTKKDYEAIAAAIKLQVDRFEENPGDPESKAIERGYRDGVCTTAASVGEMLAKDNPRFDYTRFIEACGLECANGMRIVRTKLKQL